jgi:hypothetical protein
MLNRLLPDVCSLCCYQHLYRYMHHVTEARAFLLTRHVSLVPCAPGNMLSALPAELSRLTNLVRGPIWPSWLCLHTLILDF